MSESPSKTSSGGRMRRVSGLQQILLASVAATPAAAQEAASDAATPFLFDVLVFFVSIPYTLYLVFVDGERMHLLPAPLLGLWACIWGFREWRRQGYWTPRLVPMMSVLALATIILINVDWVMNGGEMWTQRYVVIAIFGLFPYVAYIVLGGPRLLGRRRLAARGAVDSNGSTLASGTTEADTEVEAGGIPLPWAPPRVRMEGPFWVRALAIGVVGFAGLLIFAGPRVQASEIRPDLAVLRTPESLVPSSSGVELGNPGAPVTVFVFGDYQCEACAYFAENFQPMIDSAWVESGEARIVFFDRPLRMRHPHSGLAAEAAHCADDQDQFWAYQDHLFQTREEWSSLDSPSGAMNEYAVTLGLDAAAFSQCLQSNRYAELVAANEELADRLGINSTPTVILARRGGDPHRAPAYTFRAIERTMREVTARGSS